MRYTTKLYSFFSFLSYGFSVFFQIYGYYKTMNDQGYKDLKNMATSYRLINIIFISRQDIIHNSLSAYIAYFSFSEFTTPKLNFHNRKLCN